MLKILVAGGAGFIGSHLCKRLINEGHIVYCIDSLITGDKSNIVSLLDNPRFNFFNKDINQPIVDIPEINYIYHLASPASPNKFAQKSYINFPIETMLANSIGTYNLLELAKNRNAVFLFASTSEVYGDPDISPQPETYNGNVNPIGVRSVYDEGKRFGEALTFAYIRKFEINARIVRIFNTYGPFMQKDDGRVVSNFINQALENIPLTIFGDGNQTRSFCYVDDLIEGLIKTVNNENARGQVINLGNADERSINEIAKLIKSMIESKSELVYKDLPEDDPKVRKPDISKARNLLQWEPNISLENGLIKTINYFRNA